VNNPDIEVTVAIEIAEPPITLERARAYFREYYDHQAPFIAERLLDARYYHNKQIPDDVRREWKKRGQPLVWTNKIYPAISGVLGYYDSAQTDPKCEPRNPEQQDTADIATKILRYLNDCADTATVKATLSKDYLIYGTCAAIVGDDADSNSKHINVKPVRWQEFFHDPASREHDFSDATYMGIYNWMEASAVRKRFPESYEAMGSPTDNGAGLFGDKAADDNIWFSPDRKRVRVVELYFKDDADQWQRVVFTGSGSDFLDFGPSAYLDDNGNQICPIVAASFEVDPDTLERYGPIAAMRPLQNEYNSRRAVLLNEAQNHRIRQLSEGISPAQVKIAKEQAARADGVIPPGFDMVTATDIANSQAQLLAKTEADFDRLAPSSTVLSSMRGQDSGRARQILQNAGLVEWSRAFWYLEKLEERINRHLWFGAKQFISQRQWIRYTGEARAAEWIEVNVPVDARYEPVMDPQTGAPALDAMGQPQLRVVPVMEHAIAQMDVDITVTAVPDTVTLQQEANEQILKYAEGMQLPVDDPRFRMVMELFLTVDKTRQLERWDTAVGKLQQQNAPMMEMQQQMQQIQQQLQALTVQAEADKDKAMAEKARAEAEQTNWETIARQQMHQQALDEHNARQMLALQQLRPDWPTPPPGAF
jgi:hypothetical protein